MNKISLPLCYETFSMRTMKIGSEAEAGQRFKDRGCFYPISFERCPASNDLPILMKYVPNVAKFGLFVHLFVNIVLEGKF